MAAMWNQGGQPQMATAPRRGANRPPVCFNCNQEGHFVVDCPHPSRLNNGAFPHLPAQQVQAQGAPQPYQPEPGPPQGQYQPQPQYQTQPQYPPPQQYQQHAPPVPQPYSQVPTPQPYNAPPTAGYYGRSGYQPQPYNQYTPQNAPPSYGSSQFQSLPQGSGSSAHPPYQASPPNYGPQSSGYNGSYGTTPVSHSPPQQWSNVPPPSRSAPPYQRPQRSMSQLSQSEFSGTPSNHTYQPTLQQPPQQRHMSMGLQQVSQPPNPMAITQGPVPLSQAHYHRANEKSARFEHQQPGKAVGESPEPEDEQQQFDWDCKYIFKEPLEAEVVALAQPLSTTFDMTPVPQVDARSTRSVSRHARNENLRDYMKSIREAAHWSFAQEDPVFADLKTDCPLIPIADVPAWIAERQGFAIIVVPDTFGESSRKRSWANDPQEEVDGQIPLENGEELVDESRPIKRQKNAQIEGPDDGMAEAEVKEDLPTPRTPCLGTPNLDRSGPEDVDDAWAPEPGEIGSASSPVDPTEALLASLGVTGEAKPAESDPFPSYKPSEEKQSDSREQVKPVPQANGHPVPSPMPSNQQSVDSQHGPHTASQLNHLPQVAPQAGPQYGQPNDTEYGGSRPLVTPHQAQHTEPQRSASWNSGPPNNPAFGSVPQNNTPHYGPPINAPYQGGPQAPSLPSNPQYNPQRSASYPNPQYGPPQYSNIPQPNAQYSYGSNSQNSQYYGQQPYGNGPAPAQYGGPQYVHPPYTNPSPQIPPQWVNGQPQYNNAPYGPPQYENGPPVQQPHGNTAHGPPQYVNGLPNQQPYSSQPPQYGNGQIAQQPNSQFSPGQPQYNAMSSTQQPFNNYSQGGPQQSRPPQNQRSYENMPPRQDSGYISARNSYSNAAGQNGFNHEAQNEPLSQFTNSSKPAQEKQLLKSRPGGLNGRPDVADGGTSESEPGTPLSPTSAEILGKLVRQPSGKRGTGSGDEARKAKRPPPVVAEAYSRRW